MKAQTLKGTKDILPQEVYKWQYIEKIIDDVCNDFGYKEIRTPVFEHTEVFARGVGDTTDIVQKEMYTFEDKGGRSITLRPEGTAGVVRSFVQNGMASLPFPVKLFYKIAAYRYENVQKGRYREFNQFGIEAFGSVGPVIDAEVISVLSVLFKRLGIKNMGVSINSIGCPECRGKFNEALKEFINNAGIENFCGDCKGRVERNPLRLIDCKKDNCKTIMATAPKQVDYLCEECKEHFDGLRESLDNMGIDYKIDTSIVRGLDYYTKTVFEFIDYSIGAQSTFCGGGRYDGLVEMFGGNSVPGIGFAMGVERLINVMENQGIEIPLAEAPKLYIANIGDVAGKETEKIAFRLREMGISVLIDTMSKSVKAQMKYADKMNVEYTIVIGDDEISSGKCKLKEMKTGKEKEVSFENLSDILVD